MAGVVLNKLAPVFGCAGVVLVLELKRPPVLNKPPVACAWEAAGASNGLFGV